VFEPARSPAETAAAVATEQDVQSALWCLVADDFLGGALADDLGARWLTALGHPVDPADVRRVGERTWTLTRLFNVREGFERKSDALPAFFADAGEDEGDGEDEDGDVDRGTFEAALGAYYERRGWDREGRPTPGTCRRLRLDVAVPAGASGSDEEDGAAERGTTGQETAGYETADGGRETDLDST
jgi:aldehyde:ferredoxin oxidoreductase